MRSVLVGVFSIIIVLLHMTSALALSLPPTDKDSALCTPDDLRCRQDPSLTNSTQSPSYRLMPTYVHEESLFTKIRKLFKHKG